MLLAHALMMTLALPTQTKGDPFVEGYLVAREMEKMRRDIADLKALVAQLVANQQRACGGPVAETEGKTGTPKSGQRGPTVVPEPPPPPARVAGRVAYPAGSGAAYVFVEDLQDPLAKGRVVDIVQRNRRFHPSHRVVQIGTVLRFPNQDKIFHNVFSLSPKHKFDLGLYTSGDDPRRYVPTVPGVIDVFCNVHSEMQMTVLVVPNRHWSRVDRSGKFKLRLPAGTRTLVAWAPNATLQKREVQAQAGQTQNVSFSLEAIPYAVPRDKLNRQRK